MGISSSITRAREVYERVCLLCMSLLIVCIPALGCNSCPDW